MRMALPERGVRCKRSINRKDSPSGGLIMMVSKNDKSRLTSSAKDGERLITGSGLVG
jgi:hypothetical protein